MLVPDRACRKAMSRGLSAPSQVKPTYENWIIRREDWLPPFDVARRYGRDREGKGRNEP